MAYADIYRNVNDHILRYVFDRYDPLVGWIFNLDHASMPASIAHDDKTYIYQGFIAEEHLFEYQGIKTYVYLDWPTISAYALVPYEGSFVWAHTNSRCSFLIDDLGLMYCSGSNAQGALGIGETTGSFSVSNDNIMVPNYYAKTFVLVQGSDWKMVTSSDAGDAANVTWALKTDGTLWVAGANGGGLGIGGIDNLNYFTKVNDTVWRATLWGTTGAVKDSETPGYYDIYLNSGDALVFYATLTIAEWIAGFGACTPEKYAEANEGFLTYGDSSAMTFIGGSCSDIFGKTVGELWSYSQGVLTQVQPGNTWSFTSGFAINDAGLTAPDYKSGATIALKA